MYRTTMRSVRRYIARPYRCQTNSLSEWPFGASFRMRGPTMVNATMGAAWPMPYPMRAATPAQVAASAGLNRIHAPSREAAIVAIAVMPPMDPRAETKSSMVCRLVLA